MMQKEGKEEEGNKEETRRKYKREIKYRTK